MVPTSWCSMHHPSNQSCQEKKLTLLPYNIRETGMDARATLGYTIHATLYEHSRRNTGAKLVVPGLRKI